jgi:glycine C-acetyltransferase
MVQQYHDNPNSLQKSVAHFANPHGADLLARTEPFGRWIESREQAGVYPYSRALAGPPSTRCVILGSRGERWTGINFASQDYLSLSSHPAVSEAAVKAVRDYGPHSAGSGLLAGNTTESRRLEERLSRLLRLAHIALFPTGWGAGFSAVAGLVRADDYVVIDELAHACLQQGAAAATRKIFRFSHVSNQEVRTHLQRIRADDAENGILVVTEGLFSMDSDWPALSELQAICREFSATLLVDVAHDLGALGEEPGGTMEAQEQLGKIDLVIGAFSKTFASNGGFVATNSSAVKNFIRWNGGPHIFSNALSPVQCAVVSKAIEIITSEEGRTRRARLRRNAQSLRDRLQSSQLTCLGHPSAIVPVRVGSEKVARITSRKIAEGGLLGNLVEFPAVKLHQARLRLQLMADHTDEDIAQAAKIIVEAHEQAVEIASQLSDVKRASVQNGALAVP